MRSRGCARLGAIRAPGAACDLRFVAVMRTRRMKVLVVVLALAAAPGAASGGFSGHHRPRPGHDGGFSGRPPSGHGSGVPPHVVAGFGAPLRGLTTAEQERFDAGLDAFEEVEVPADGLGPVFNDASCAACHTAGATGGGSELVETRFGKTTAGGGFDPMTEAGGSLIQTTGIGVAGACTFTGEVVPADASVVAGRRTTPLFGLGLVDAVPDATLFALARKQARFQPATAGRPHVVFDIPSGKQRVGRFGWKNQVATLLHFSGDAYLNEMGITTPFFPDESCPQGDCALLACDPVPGVDDDLEDVEKFRDFMAFLAPPPRARGAYAAWEGSQLFDQVGCASCHVRALTTGPSQVAALRYRTFQPFSDFLLHDMGSLGDGIEQGQASGREMRTAPLWGLRIMTTFLHDGRAHSVDDAILAHDGQARRARDRFAGLDADRKAKLLKFLGTL
jgi:CxxC motif-containing protein (DUF1111 family)